MFYLGYVIVDVYKWPEVDICFRKKVDMLRML